MSDLARRSDRLAQLPLPDASDTPAVAAPAPLMALTKRTPPVARTSNLFMPLLRKSTDALLSAQRKVPMSPELPLCGTPTQAPSVGAGTLFGRRTLARLPPAKLSRPPAQLTKPPGTAERLPKAWLLAPPATAPSLAARLLKPPATTPRVPSMTLYWPPPMKALPVPLLTTLSAPPAITELPESTWLPEPPPTTEFGAATVFIDPPPTTAALPDTMFSSPPPITARLAAMLLFHPPPITD